MFQSTLPRRERPCEPKTSVTDVPVSIHAPTKGATDQWNRQNEYNLPFQSTLPRRERLNSLTTCFNRFCFNPRSHEGSDLTRTTDHVARHSFNPRSHEGSDLSRVHRRGTDKVSIHAPTKGATLRTKMIGFEQRFQSTLPRRERPSRPVRNRRVQMFQSTLPRRERPII